MHKVFHHHDIPNNIINDHGPQLKFKFSKHLFTMLKVSCKLILDYHPQIDGPTKHWSNISNASSIINKIIGLIYYIFQNLHIIILYIPLQGSPPSLIVFIWSSQIIKSYYQGSFKSTTTYLDYTFQSSIRGSSNTQIQCSSISTFQVGDRVWL